MSDKLTIRITLAHHCRLYDLSYLFEQNQARIHVRHILQKINQFIVNIDYTVRNYLNIWIQTKNGRENLFKLKERGTLISLGLNQNAIYELNITLEDIEQKHNLMKFFHNSTEQYNRLNNNINRMIDQSKEEEKKRGQKSLRPIDIAYFFADPLVTMQKGKIIATHQVSYQLQYDRFIEILKKQEFRHNFRVEMMVATKTNIRNTLFEGASILHFACHGKDKIGNLQIQSQTSIGELVDLQHSQFLNLLDIRTVLPKLIIFNVCFSSILAKKIYETKKIMTIGYEGKASDIYCQMFTKEFYMGLFKDKMPVRKLFNMIKEKITKLQEIEGKKLKIFPQQPQKDEIQEQFLESTETKFNYIKRWTFSESMRENDSLGVKIQMYQFIKQYLTHREAMSYMILKGEKISGKSDFIKKVRIYIMNRKVFSQDFLIDLKNYRGEYIQNMLQFKLQKEDLIIKKVNQFKQSFKEKKFIPLVILDHCDKIIKAEYNKFIEYLQNKIIKELKFGKVVIITNNVTPILYEDEEKFNKAHTHIKESPQIDKIQFVNYVKRYCKVVENTALEISRSNLCPLIDLVLALKQSKSQSEFQNILYKRESSSSNEKVHNRSQLSLTLQFIDEEITKFSQIIEELRSCTTIRIEQNDFIFMSTMFNEIKLQKNLQYTSIKCVTKSIEQQMAFLVFSFKKFFKKIFKFKRQDQEKFKALKKQLSLKKIFEISLTIASILYFYQSSILLEQHLTHCQTLYNLISSHYTEQLKKPQSNIVQTVHQYHLKVLLTLYSYFSQKYYRIYYLLQYDESMNIEEDQKNSIIYRKKSKMIQNEIIELYFKVHYENVQNLLKQVFIINEKIQELHYNKKYMFFHEIEGRPRRQSEVIQNNQNFIDNQFDEKEIISKIKNIHKEIEEYWKSFRKIQQYQENSKLIISKECIYIMRLNIMKLIYYNLRQFQQIVQKGESFITENLIRIIVYYKEIMNNIENERVFCKSKTSNGLFNNHECESLKPLFQQYLKTYVEIYFNISILYQNFHKEYNLKIYYTLIELCEGFTNISGINSIKKMIEEHLNNQFFNTWTCTIFMACPLVEIERKNNNIKKNNIKRYEYYVISFLQNFYEDQVDKEIKYGIKLMSRQTLKAYEYNKADSEKRNLIQLIICDLNINNEKNYTKLYLQDQNGASIRQDVDSINLPHAPVLIFFGQNIQEIRHHYKKNHSQSIIITINIREEDCLKTPTGSQRDKKHMEMYSEYSIRLQIYYTVLQYFYTSFCRHFFNDNSHNYFIDQVKSSYDLAKAETLIKTKLLYSNDRGFSHTEHIIDVLGQIDCNLNYLIQSPDGLHLIQRQAYNFIYKQSCPLNLNSKFKIDKKDLLCQIGCNEEINQLLYTIHHNKQTINNLLIYYKSQQMLHFYINTLKAKLYKLNTFRLSKEEIYQHNYHQYRQTIKNQISSSTLQQYNQTTEDLEQVTIFIGLSQTLILQQLMLPTPNQNKQSKLFFTSKILTSLQNIHKTRISENYKHNKVQYELYYLECKQGKNMSSDKEKKCLKGFYEMAENEMNGSASLLDVKNVVEKYSANR